jgi:hypothetical protein
MAHEGQLTEDILKFLGISTDYRDYIRICDSVETQDKKQLLVLVRTIPNFESKLEKDPKLSKVFGGLKAPRTPLDGLDSGIVVSISQDQESNRTFTIVARSEDRPRVEVPQASLVEAYITSHMKEHPDDGWKAWKEGSIIRVFTVETTRGKETFVTTRTKLSAGGHWPNAADSPTVIASFREACKKQQIERADIEVPGYCFCFVLSSKWNTMKQHTETTHLTLFRVYSWLEGEYREVKYDVTNVATPATLSIEEAIQHVLDGGVVMTTNAFENTKVMLPQTGKEYSWLESPNAVHMYFGLDARDRKRFKTVCSPYLRDKVIALEKSLPTQKDGAAAWIMHELQNNLQTKDGKQETKSKKHNKAGALAIESIIRTLKKRYAEERAAAIEKGTFKPRAKNGKGRNPIFYWGRTKAAQYERQLALVNEILQDHLEHNGCLLLRIIKECTRRKTAEGIKLRKKEEALRKKDATSIPQDLLNEIKDAMASLDSITLPEKELFLPFQVDDDL